MALKHDAQGFLVGDPIDLSKALADWAVIRDDVREIRQAVLGIQRVMNRTALEVRSSMPTTPGRGNDVGRSAVLRAPAQPLGRDSRGRFVKNSAGAGSPRQSDTAEPDQNKRDSRAESVRPALPGRLMGVTKESGAGLQEADPTIKAFNEVAQPMARGYELLTGGDRRNAGGRGGDDKRGGDKQGGDKQGDDKQDDDKQDDDKQDDDKQDSKDERELRSLADRIVDVTKESGAGLQEADPTIKAFNEVAQPMARGYELLTGGDRQKKQERWLRRIWTILARFRKEGGLFHKVAAKRLKAIEEKPVAKEGGSGLFGGLLGVLLTKVSGPLGRLGNLLTKIGGLLGLGKGVTAAATAAGDASATAVAGGKGAAAKGGGGLLKKGGLFKKAGGLFKRIPLLGTLLSVGGAAADIYDAENDDTLTRRDKDKRDGRAVGGAAGGLGGLAAGAAAGAAIGSVVPVIGTAIGGLIGGAVGMFFGDQAGQILGSIVGGWVNDLRAADIPGKISGAWQVTTTFLQNAWTEIKVNALGVWDWVKSGWDSVVGTLQKGWDATMSAFSAVGDAIKKAWGGFVDTAKAGWESISGAFASAYEGLKSLPGIGPAIKAAEAGGRKVAEMAGAVKDGAVEIGGKTVDAVKSGASRAWGAVKDGAGSAWDKTKQATSHAWDKTKYFAASLVPQGLKEKIAARRAMEIGANDAQDNAAGQQGEFASGVKSISKKDAERWNDAKQYLMGASDNAGVDAGTVAKIANFESGFNADAAPIRKDGTRISSAHGYGQFIDGTWTDMLNKYGGKYGVDGAGKLTKEQAAKFRGDKTIQAAMLAEFTRENIEKGRKYGGTDDDANVYAFHNLGDKDAKNLLTGMRQNPSMTVREALLQGAKTDKERARVEAVITNNKSLYGDGSVTAAEAYSRMGQVMRRGEVFAADAQQAQQAGGGKRPPSYATAKGEAKPAASTPALAQTPALAAPAGVVVPVAPVVAAVSVPTVPAAPVVPPIAEAPPVAVPMAGGDARKPVAVVSAPAEVGQDMRERGIAHIATGGLGGAGVG